MSHDDAVNNTSHNPHIDDLIEQRLRDPRRRGLLRGGLGLAALSFIGSSSALLAACGGDDDPAPAPAPAPAPPPAGPARPSSLGFAAAQIDHDWVGSIAAVALLGSAETSAANPPVRLLPAGAALSAAGC